MVLFEGGNRLGLAVLRDLKILFMQASNGVALAVGHDDVDQDQTNLSFDRGDAIAGVRSGSLGAERDDRE